MCNFKENYEILLSQERLSSYDNDIEAHFRNLKIIALVTPKLATLEICLRNRCDYLLCEKLGENWLIDIDDEILQKELIKICDKEGLEDLNGLTRHQYISRLTLGVFVRIIKKYALQNLIFDLREMNFKHYDRSNRNFCFIKGKKTKISNYDKVDIVLSLFQTIRNRSFHWENLMKIRNNDGKIFPRLTTKKYETIIGIAPQNIQAFLNDLLDNINKDLIENCEIKLK